MTVKNTDWCHCLGSSKAPAVYPPWLLHHQCTYQHRENAKTQNLSVTMKTRFGGLSQSVVYFKNCWYRIHDMLCSYPVSTPLAFLFGVFSHITSLTPLPLSEAKPSRHWRTDTHPESAQSGLLGRDSGGSAVRKQTSARSFHLAGVSGLPSLSWALPSISGADCCVWAHTGGSGGALWDSPRVTRHCFWWCAPTPDSLVV